jgi:hypothetical protein
MCSAHCARVGPLGRCARLDGGTVATVPRPGRGDGILVRRGQPMAHTGRACSLRANVRVDFCIRRLHRALGVDSTRRHAAPMRQHCRRPGPRPQSLVANCVVRLATRPGFTAALSRAGGPVGREVRIHVAGDALRMAGRAQYAARHFGRDKLPRSRRQCGGLHDASTQVAHLW